MNTPTHFLINVAIKKWRDRRGLPLAARSFLLGSVLPDVPLLLLTAGYFLYRYFYPIDEFIFGPTYDALYFENPVWLAGHNLFHAPLMLLMLVLLGGWLRGNRPVWGARLLWFAAGCGVHSVVDILTHHDDGPLLFFPLDWSIRFISPVSYWDPAHYGNVVAPLELGLNVAVLLWVGVAWVRRRRRQRSPLPPGEG
jgi:membrane-bound metal-dependent hydrolase YbcI (DUF457 family)